MYEIYTVSTSTWKGLARVDPKSCSWKRRFNGSAGALQASFKVSDPAVLLTVDSGLLEPIERCLVIAQDNVVVYAGIIWEDDYDDDSRTLTVSHEDIWSLLALRIISELRDGTIPGWVKTFTALEYDTIVKRLIQLGTSGAGREIPIQYEADYSGGRERKYYGYNVDTVADAISEIMNLPNGPNIDFRPEWNAARDGIQWTLRTGNMNPDSQTIEVITSVVDSAIRGLKRKRSGRERATRVIGVGEGTGKDVKVRASAGTGALALERVEQAKNVKTLADLQEFADGELAPRNKLIEQYSMELDVTKPNLASVWSLKPGAFLRWYVSGNPIITAGWRTQSIISYAGDISSDWLALELQ